MRIVVYAFLVFVVNRGVDGLTCYSCSYSDNPSLVGYECVISPADYVLGPSTTQCDTACSTTVQKLSGNNNIWYMTRGCQTEPGGCSSGGGIDKCVDVCSDADLCNDINYAPEPLPSTTTVITTTTTEAPGTRDCYSCVYSYHPDGDDRCVTDPPNVPPPNTVRCPPDRVCSTFRQWDKGNNYIRSFRRGCDPPPGGQDGCLEDTYFITCNWYCQPELCNYGDGTAPTDRHN